jgi:prostaglandin reductase 1
MQIGDQMIGSQIARVIKSRCPEFPEGCQVVGHFGWRDLTIYKPDPNGPRAYPAVYKIPDMKGLPDAYALGCMGMTGNTAYFGLLDICQPKPGETLVVSAAAGSVGNLVGQIGKIKGCKVVGFAGSEDKVKWLKDDLGFDEAINYKTMVDTDATLKRICPEGIDCYFDNVGGEFAYHVMRNMRELGRICLCGSLSNFTQVVDPNAVIMEPIDYGKIRGQRLKLEGMNVQYWQNQWFDGINQVRDWILEGKIKTEQTVADGFEKMPQAFIDLMHGKNMGKQIVKA